MKDIIRASTEVLALNKTVLFYQSGILGWGGLLNLLYSLEIARIFQRISLEKRLNNRTWVVAAFGFFSGGLCTFLRGLDSS